MLLLTSALLSSQQEAAYLKQANIHQMNYLWGAFDQSPIQIDSLVIVIKGEITKDTLHGLRPGRERSAEQIVAGLYREKGPEMVSYLDGLFFIFIYDQRKEVAYFFNNPYQACNFYYYENKGQFIGSSSLTAMIPYLKDGAEPFFPSIRQFLSNGFTISDQTQIKGIKKLLPAHWLEVTPNSTEVKNYWNHQINFDRKPLKDLEQSLDQYEEVYRSGLRDYLDQRKPTQLATLLSGGHDTSFAMIQSSMVFNKPVHAFTTTFPGWAFDEGEYAENICNKFGGVYHQVPFLPKDLDHTVSLIRANEEPVVGSSLPLHLIGKLAAEHTDTILGGDGGDTLWGEYFPVAEVHRYLKHLPLGIRKMIHSFAKGLLKATDWERFWELEHVTSLFAKENFYEDFMRRLCTYRHFSDDFQNELFISEIANKESFSKSLYQVEFNRDNFDESLIEGKLFNAFYTYQSFHTTKSMRHFGMELYLPTIQQDVIRFITDLPKSWVNGGTSFHRLINSKSINRKFHKLALARYLRKDEIYNRSFDIPWYNILRPRKYLLENLLKRLKKRGWYREDSLDNLFREFESQNVKSHELLELKHHGYRIFTLLSLEIWCMEYIDGVMTPSPDEEINLEDYLYY